MLSRPSNFDMHEIALTIHLLHQVVVRRCDTSHLVNVDVLDALMEFVWQSEDILINFGHDLGVLTLILCDVASNID